jgi:hypothetical protein
MLMRLLQGLVLLALTVTFHAFVLSMLVARVQKISDRMLRAAHFTTYAFVLVRVAAITLLAHLVEIALWAAFFYWKEALPDFELSFYFSAVTYATIGYGDVLLPIEWRLLAPMEGLTGILMCGWSAAFFFALATRLYSNPRLNK